MLIFHQCAISMGTGCEGSSSNSAPRFRLQSHDYVHASKSNHAAADISTRQRQRCIAGHAAQKGGLTLPRTVFMVSMYWLRPMPSRRTPVSDNTH